MRVSRRTHQTLSELAGRKCSSISDLLDQLVESARRREILGQYNTRMAEVLADPAERDDWSQETARSEVSAEVSAAESISFSEHATITR